MIFFIVAATIKTYIMSISECGYTISDYPFLYDGFHPFNLKKKPSHIRPQYKNISISIWISYLFSLSLHNSYASIFNFSIVCFSQCFSFSLSPSLYLPMSVLSTFSLPQLWYVMYLIWCHSFACDVLFCCCCCCWIEKHTTNTHSRTSTTHLYT